MADVGEGNMRVVTFWEWHVGWGLGWWWHEVRLPGERTRHNR